ncbi:KN motif and ankyrin repeat domain-containing protein 2 [Latimeria chalumnae]|uniref:KN motif and ankyrin repeat domain-containing protein 2 n=1 Tax=Latimeria chalumnae TaxID=7897 RepID=UPI0003C14259|nr:PREDICTED: KN motif and ankyrin repeat domain-containing protein 2 [Latimeria chalumnae]XP_005994227.1 PREDICTED: KN motif and ankyrin repeat domain-containing protein 2 [Latimeria chalumnae]XP_005994228.1 PREDICTED: KN motif and ankyrin repeat domain-containing protein 2 [Latimeria chalumnae]|eukprot:XP_005994226.1 PREDICTED: KN motif and ankyrin repeat domain-containing protein 2 [Latimeria chalumnae]
MAQVLHMETNFPGKSNPTSPTAFRGKDQDLPYSVETPYGYRLDLDFLKYVDDIEKGHTIKKVPIHRRPRYSSLPRGYGYTGSWWTSTESLCSNASMDSRYSSFSYCGRGFYPAYGVENRPPLLTSGYNARVEKTLLDAKRRLEEDQADSAEDRRSRFASLGSLHGSVSGSTSSLSGAGLSQSLSKMSSHSNSQSGVSGQYTPMSSGLSTPVSPTPAHLQHVREQMAVALRKLRQLEEQVKMIPVLQVKISVLQEEKRQLSVQLKSQKFLGHTTGFGKPKPRGELYIDIPEEDSDQSGSVFSPPLPGSSRSHSGTEIEGSMMQRSLIKSPKKEMRSISVGTGEEMMVRESRPSASVGLGQTREVKEVGISVKEHDLGLSSVATQAEVEHQRQTIEALAAKISVLEKQLKKALQELQVAHQKLEQQAKEITEREKATKPSTADAIIMTCVGWQELQAGQPRKLAEVSEVGLQTSNQLELVDQRTMGVQVYISEQPTSGTKDYKEVPVKVDQLELIQTQKETKGSASPAVPVNLQAPVPQRTEPVESSTVGAPKNEGAYLDQVPVFKTLFTSKTEVPYILYKNPEAVETVFPIQADHCTEVLHVVKKISLTTETYEDKLKGVDDPAVLVPAVSSSEEVSEVLQKPSQMIVLSASSAPVAVEMGGTVLSASAQQEGPPSPEANTCSSSVASEQGSALSTRDAPQPASPETSLKSIMKRKDDTAFLDPASRKNLQFVGVNGGYESTSSDTSSEDSSSENESSESEYHEANEGPPAGHAGQPAEQKPQEMETSDTNNNEKEDSEGEKPTLVTAAAGESASSEEATEQKFQMSESLLSASMTLQKYLENPDAVSNMAMKAAYATVLQDWLRISCHKAADQNVVRHHMIVFQAMSPQLLEFVVNMADGNGNTALHYTVSHSNFPIVRLLLETGMCNVDKQNKAGYTAIMLTALAAFRSEGDMETVTQLLHHGNVNAKASQAGQTALMLAVSHGRIDMVKALLAGGADVNLQDDDGSTALMCACEHGHVEIVRLLLAVPGCDVTLTDNDGSTALSVALEANQNEIAMLLHSHMNLTKALAPVKETQPGPPPNAPAEAQQ